MISSWEMSTIGHPLSDLSNLFTPYIAPPHPSRALSFSSDTLSGLPSKAQCLEWYAEIAGWNPASEQPWGDAFGMFRSSIIAQGIAARYARRQASSAQAKSYGDGRTALGETAWRLIEKLKEG